MECFVALLIFAFIAILVSGLGLGLGPQNPGRAYQSLVRRFGGTFQRGGILRRPSVRFRYGPTWVTISPGPNRGHQKTTQAHLYWPDARTDLRVESLATWNRSTLSDIPGDIEVGDEQFDHRFRVSGSRPNDVRRLLSDGVRWQINKLCQFFDHPFISVAVRNGRMIIEKPVAFRRGEDLEEFAQLCLELFDQAMLTRSEGIEFLGRSDEAQPIEDPVCQICGEEITSDMVFCRRCRTPHHLDCWQYNGACSTYGCRETRYAVPTLAQRVSRPDSDDEPQEDAPNRADSA